MKKLSSLLISAIAMAGFSASALDFTVLSTPEEVYANSFEDEAGAKAAFKAVLNNAESTDAEKLAAMQEYQQKATPAPTFGFDMTYLMSYTAVTAENLGKYTQTKLAEAWQNDIEGLTFGADRVLAASAPADADAYMCVNSSVLSTDAAFGKFAAYQNVNLAKGSYELCGDAYLSGAAKVVTLNAGENESAPIIGGGKLAPYSVNFKLDEAQEIKLGFKRNSTAGKLTRIYFNNVELYKVSSYVAITEDAEGPLAAAEGVDVMLCRSFKAGEYYPICLPFIVENWNEVFEELLIWTNYANGTFDYKTVTGANTQARKPYLVKFKEEITPDNYLVFNNVTVTKGNAGTWKRTSEENFPVFMTGNWAKGTIPAGSYYYQEGNWHLSDGTAPLTAFSAYMDATALEEKPETISMIIDGIAASASDIFSEAAPAFVNVYNLQGMMLRSNVAAESALDELPAGIYIVNGKKVLKR